MSHREMRRSGSDEGGSSPREVTQGPRRGRAFEHIPSTDSPERQNVECAGQPKHMQWLSQMAGETLRPSTEQDMTEPPPTPRLGFFVADFDDPIPAIEHESTATDRHEIKSYDDTNETLSKIAEKEFNITKIFLESDSASVTHEFFMEQMRQAHAQRKTAKTQEIYDRLYNSIQQRAVMPPRVKKERVWKSRDTTTTKEDPDVLDGF